MTPAGDARELALEAGLEDLARVRAFVDDAMRGLGVDAQARADLLLAVDEAVTNVVLHGYGGGRGPLALCVDRDGADLRIVIRDRAPLFDPSEASRPQLDTELADRPIGGMGVFLVRQAADRLEHAQRAGGGNVLTLTRRVQAAGRAEG